MVYIRNYLLWNFSFFKLIVKSKFVEGRVIELKKNEKLYFSGLTVKQSYCDIWVGSATISNRKKAVWPSPFLTLSPTTSSFNIPHDSLAQWVRIRASSDFRKKSITIKVISKMGLLPQILHDILINVKSRWKGNTGRRGGGLWNVSSLLLYLFCCVCVLFSISTPFFFVVFLHPLPF